MLKAKGILLSLLMVISAVAAYTMRPQSQENMVLEDRVLDNSIPTQFADWVAEDDKSGLVINGDVQKQLEDIYGQVLARSYIHKKSGYRIMLSVSHGGEQSRALQIHRPEVCYAAQGFRISDTKKSELDIGPMHIPVMEMIATYETRHEPVIYWVRIGNSLVRGNIEQGIARVQYGLQRKVPDGLLFRVSSIDKDYSRATSEQKKFIADLVPNLSPEGRRLILGEN